MFAPDPIHPFDSIDGSDGRCPFPAIDTDPDGRIRWPPKNGKLGADFERTANAQRAFHRLAILRWSGKLL